MRPCYCRSVKKARRLGKKSHRVTLAEWKPRPFSEKIMEHAAELLRSQL